MVCLKLFCVVLLFFSNVCFGVFFWGGEGREKVMQFFELEDGNLDDGDYVHVPLFSGGWTKHPQKRNERNGGFIIDSSAEKWCLWVNGPCKPCRRFPHWFLFAWNVKGNMDSKKWTSNLGCVLNSDSSFTHGRIHSDFFIFCSKSLGMMIQLLL